MNEQEISRRARRSLTLTFSMFFFLVILVTMTVAVSIVRILSVTGTLSAAKIETGGLTFLLIIALLCTVLGTVFTWITVRILLNPINRLVNGMRQLASGDYSVRLKMGKLFRRNHTFREVTDAFNTLATELQHTEMLRTDFINNFSHEFKTPIVSVAGFAKLLKRKNLTPEQQAGYLNAIEEESLRLSHMATNVLNLTRVENQEILSNITEYNLSEQLRTAVLQLEEKWVKKNIELNFNFEEYNIRAEKELLKQVWLNILDNAVKFTPDYGVITASITQNEVSTSVSITNTGSMIPAAEYERIFKKFYQVDESHSSAGNGIGLSVVKRITELHKGTVDVKSDCDSTCFTVTIPRNL